jgi:hypothetical protein
MFDACLVIEKSHAMSEACAAVAFRHRRGPGDKLASLARLNPVYEIVQQLPESNGEHQYKIKSVDEPHLRVAKEHQLRRV